MAGTYVLRPNYFKKVRCLYICFCILQKTHQKQAPTALGPSLSNAKLKMLYADVLNVTEGARKVCFTTKLLFAKPPRRRRLDAPFVLNRRASRGAPTWGHDMI